MAAPEFGAPFPFVAMSTSRGPQGADVSGPWPPAVSPIHQRQGWEHDVNQAVSYQTDNPFLPPPQQQQYRNSPYQHSYYQQSPYTPYTGHGWPSIQMYPTLPLSVPSHHPRPPPAIRSGHVDALINPSVSGPDMYREASMNYGSHYTASQGHGAWSPTPQPFAPTENSSNTSLNEVPSGQATSNSGAGHQPSHGLPLHLGFSGPTLPQRPDQFQRRHNERNTATRRVEHAGSRTLRDPTVQARRPDLSSSPRTPSNRRSFNRYSADLSLSSTSSDIEEAAARSPPSDRVRHQAGESRLRFFRQAFDPNVTTESQIQVLKANLPRLLLGDLPKDVSPTCDICAKDYSATHVQPSEEEEIAVKLPCGHTFGEFCINQWVCESASPTISEADASSVRDLQNT